MVRDYLPGGSDSTRENGFKLTEQVYIEYQEEILHCGGGNALEQDLQRRYRCPIPGGVKGQFGWGFEHPGVIKGVLIDRKLELGDL